RTRPRHELSVDGSLISREIETGANTAFNFIPRTARVRIFLIGSQASCEQRFLVVGKRIVLVEPTTAVEFGEPQTDLISVLWCEFGKFFENFSLTHIWIILSTIVSINSAARPRIGACLLLTPCFSWVALTGFRPENGFNRLPYA